MSFDFFTFEESPWDIFAGNLKMGDRVSAARFLTLLEGEPEDTVENAFQTLEDISAVLDISDLPKILHSGEAGKRLALEEKLVKQDGLLKDLPEGDPLRLYLEELAAIPVCGDVNLLSMELAEANREELDNAPVQSQLVNLSLSRVVELAAEYTGRGVLLMDLIQEGSMGLWQGILSYTAGLDFESVRDWWIRQYMARAVVLQARENGVGQKMRQSLEDLQAADKRLLTKIGRNPTLEELALELNKTPEETAVLEKMLQDVRTVAKARAAQAPVQDDPDDEKHVEDTAYFQMRQRIMELLSGLSEQDAQVLTLRYGLEGGMPLSPQDTGVKLGLTPEEVLQKEASALSKLRNER